MDIVYHSRNRSLTDGDEGFWPGVLKKVRDYRGSPDSSLPIELYAGERTQPPRVCEPRGLPSPI